jgi:hypothetical protein
MANPRSGADPATGITNVVFADHDDQWVDLVAGTPAVLGDGRDGIHEVRGDLFRIAYPRRVFDPKPDAVRMHLFRQRHFLAHPGPIIKPPRILDPRRPRRDDVEPAQPAVVRIDMQRGLWKRRILSRRRRGLWSGWSLSEERIRDSGCERRSGCRLQKVTALHERRRVVHGLGVFIARFDCCSRKMGQKRKVVVRFTLTGCL